MTEILFIIGMGLVIVGKVRFGMFDAEGHPVRAAGFMLMMPLIVVLFLSFVLGVITGGDTVAMSRTLPFVLFLQLPVAIVCVGVAYSLLRKRSDEEKLDEPPSTSAQPVEPPKPKPEPLPRRPLGGFPSVMGTAEAARYLNVTEQAVMKLIEDGKITAARINYRYKISRSVLDEFLQDQKMDPSAE